MAKPEWGTKRVCQACGNKFDDLLRSPIVCPSCGVEFDPEALLRSRRSSRPAAVKEEPEKKKVAAPAKKAEDEIEEAFDADLEDEDLDDDVSSDDDSDDDPIEDASELGEDDDLGDVKIKDKEEEA